MTIAFVVLVVLLVLVPFRRLKGGAGGGSEKGVVGALWVLAGVVIAVLIAQR
jgi:hypothetical protein